MCDENLGFNMLIKLGDFEFFIIYVDNDCKDILD